MYHRLVYVWYASDKYVCILSMCISSIDHRTVTDTTSGRISLETTALKSRSTRHGVEPVEGTQDIDRH